MQAVSSKAFVSGKAVRAAAPAPRAARAAVVVRASAEESRRAVLGSLLAGVAALTASSAQAIDIIDDRAVRERGFDIIYEARDLDLPQSVRDGLSQARENVDVVRSRIAESEKRVDTVLETYISKAYWSEGMNELRRQVGTLRFDINTLADRLTKAEKKEALAAKAEFLAAVDKLDFAMRKKNQAAAAAALEQTKSTLDAVIAKLV